LVYTQKKPLQNFPGGGTKMTARDVLFSAVRDCYTAAIENQITEKNANQVQARILCEGATSDDMASRRDYRCQGHLHRAGHSRQRRRRHGQLFRMVQDRQGFFWRESEVNERLFDVMDNAFRMKWVRFAGIHKVNNRIAAYMLAIDRVASALKLRGIYA